MASRTRVPIYDGPWLTPDEIEKVRGRWRKHPLPCIGQTFGQIKVLGFGLCTRRCVSAIVECGGCGFGPYLTDLHKLLFKYRSCGLCAVPRASKARYGHPGFTDIIADSEVLRRLTCRYHGMMRRCNNPRDASYLNYGGRGIKVYPEWSNGYEGKRSFLEYIKTLDGYDNPELKMDREDNDGNYEPGNIRFVTQKENVYNTRVASEAVAVCEQRHAEELAILQQKIARLQRQIAFQQPQLKQQWLF